MDLLKDNQKRHKIKFLINSKDKHELIDKNQLKNFFQIELLRVYTLIQKICNFLI